MIRLRQHVINRLPVSLVAAAADANPIHPTILCQSFRPPPRSIPEGCQPVAGG